MADESDIEVAETDIEQDPSESESIGRKVSSKDLTKEELAQYIERNLEDDLTQKISAAKLALSAGKTDTARDMIKKIENITKKLRYVLRNHTEEHAVTDKFSNLPRYDLAKIQDPSEPELKAA